MAKLKNISIVLVLLLALATSCSKFAPLEKRLDANSSHGTPGIKAQSTNDLNNVTETPGGITDPNNDEDHDAEGGTITDTENDEDHDKDAVKGK